MSTKSLPTTPIASRLRRATSAALKFDVITALDAVCFDTVTKYVAQVEVSRDRAYGAWKAVAIGVIQLEYEWAACTASAKRTQIRNQWCDTLSPGFRALYAGTTVFPRLLDAHAQGLTFDFDERDISFRLMDSESQRLMMPENSESLMECVWRLEDEWSELDRIKTTNRVPDADQ